MPRSMMHRNMYSCAMCYAVCCSSVAFNASNQTGFFFGTCFTFNSYSKFKKEKKTDTQQKKNTGLGRSEIRSVNVSLIMCFLCIYVTVYGLLSDSQTPETYLYCTSMQISCCCCYWFLWFNRAEWDNEKIFIRFFFLIFFTEFQQK